MVRRYSGELEQVVKKILNNVRQEQEEARYSERKSSYESSESNVEHQIINPIIAELGWDITDPKQVTTKYLENSSEKPDFVLRDEYGPVVIIEAKAMGRSGGADNLAQVVRYLKYCPNVILTDGIVWSYYSASDLEFTFNTLPYDSEEWMEYFKQEILPTMRPMWEFDFLRHHMQYCLSLLSSIYRNESFSLEKYGSEMEESRYVGKSLESTIIENQLESAILDVDIFELVVNEINSKLQEFSRRDYGHELSYDKIDTQLTVYLEDLVKQYIYENVRSKFKIDEKKDD